MRSVLALLVALSVPVACAGKVSSSEADAATDAGADASPTDSPSSESTATPQTCQACVDATCPDSWNACLADAECVALIDCLSKCTSAACESSCKSAHPSATGDAVLACFRGPCKDACTKTVGG